MTGCQLGDIQLTKSNNNDDPEVSWSYPDGCVISTPQLSTSLGSILTEINKKSKEKKQETRDHISAGINDNNTATTQHNEATSQNNTNTSINKRSAEDVRRTTRTSKSTTANLLADESSYNTWTPATSATANTEQNKYNNMKLDCQTGWTAVNNCNATCGVSTWGYYASGTQRYRTYISRYAQNGGDSSCREGVQQDFGCSRWCPPGVNYSYTYRKVPYVAGNTNTNSLIWNKGYPGYWTGFGTPSWLCDTAPYNQSAYREYEYIYNSSTGTDFQARFHFQGDNTCQVFLNNVFIGSNIHWHLTVTAVGTIKYGNNRILLKVTNLDPGGAGGVILSCSRLSDNAILFVTNGSWRMS
jgi:hypothetical protein